jgi:iron complex outermembrane receptor protein
MNHTRVNMIGFETGLDIFTGEWLAFLRPSVHYTYLQADKSADNLVSNYTLDYLKHQLDIITQWQIISNLSIQINTSWRERQGGYMLFEDGIFTETVDFKPFWLIDTRVAYTFGNLEIFTSVTNLLDSNQVSIANVPQPGRWITGGLRYQLSSNIPGSN